MPTWTAVSPVTILAKIRLTFFDKVYDNTYALDAGERFRGAKVKRSANKSLTTSTTTAVDWDAEDWDTDGWHDSVTNNDRLAVPAGFATTKYRHCFQASFAAHATGAREVLIDIANPTTTEKLPSAQYPVSSGSAESRLNGSGIVIMAAAQYGMMKVQQDSGTSLNLNCTAQISSWYSIELVK